MLFALQLAIRPALWQWVRWPTLVFASVLVIEMLVLAVIAGSAYGLSKTTLRDWRQRMWGDLARTPIGAYRDTLRVKAIVRLQYEVEDLISERARVTEEEREGVQRERVARRYDQRAAELGFSDERRRQLVSAVRSGREEQVHEYLMDVREIHALYGRARDLGEEFRGTLGAFLRSHQFDIAAADAFVVNERQQRALLAEAHEFGLSDVTRADVDAGKKEEIRARIERARDVAARQAALDRLHERIQQLSPEHRGEPLRLLADARTTVEHSRTYRKAFHTLSCSIDHAKSIEARGRRRHRMS